MTRVSGRGPVRVFVAACLLALIACEGLPTGARQSPSPYASTDGRLAAADAKLYTGDYEAAEARYRELAAARVSGAAAHLSTLLAYESRMQEAVAQARAAVEVRADSESLARLTRALDWVQDLDEALAVGARAVATKPVHPLAHVFYAEVLADLGRFDAAVKELRAAESMDSDAYVGAEIDRQWANYYRNRGDWQTELNQMQLALKEQPRFPERQLELLRFHYGRGRADSVQRTVDKLLADFPKSYRVLTAAADAALFGGDLQAAERLYTTAADVRPDGADAALGRAEAMVLARRDFNGAHDLLLELLKRNPTAGSVYQYVRFLDLLVLNRDADAELKTVVAQPPDDLGMARKAVLDRINGYRGRLGLVPIREDPALADGALAHAYHYLFNANQRQLAGLGIHSEDRELPGFVGATALDRARRFGFRGGLVGEVINHAYTPDSSVEQWMDSVFHRYPLTGRETQAAGYGEAQVGSLRIAVLDLGFSAPGTSEPVVYPAADQVGVPAAFLGNEIPDPLPEGAPYPAGYPVTLQLGGGQTLTVTTGRLLDADGREVPSYTLQPGQRVASSEWALVAQQPLRPGATYTAEVLGKLDGQDFSRRWSFTVASP